MIRRSSTSPFSICTWSFILLFLLTAGTLVSMSFGQSATAAASISGAITDSSGAKVISAGVTLTEVSIGSVRSAISNQDGFYYFEFVAPGKYVVRVTKSGFATTVSTPVDVMVGQSVTFNTIMPVASITQDVTVTAAVAILDTSKTDVSSNLSPTEVQSLPLNGRDFGNLATLAPGARPTNPYDPTKTHVATFSVNGSDGRNVNSTIDGVDNKDNGVGGPVMQLSLNAVQEFVISTQRFSAVNGRSEGAAINVIIEQGTNRFHGGLQLYDTETALNADDYFSKQTGSPTPEFSRQLWGGQVGGPIRKDKDFFFFALDQQRWGTAIAVAGTAYQQLQLMNSYGADAVTSIPTPYNDTRYTARVDHVFNASNNLHITFNRQSNNALNDQDANDSAGSENNYTDNSLILAGATLTSVLSPTVVNSFTLGYQYWNDVIKTNSFTPVEVEFPDSISFGTSGDVPQGSDQKKWQFRDDISIARGKHSLKTGVDYIYEPLLGGFFGSGFTPSITFSDLPSTIINNTNSKYPEGFATPGAATAMSVSTGNQSFDEDGGTKMIGIYAQDDWTVTKRLKVNLGVRWDKDFNTYNTTEEGQNRTYLELKAIGSPYAASLPKNDNRDLSPRVGFSFDPTGSGRQTILGGFGIYYGQTFINEPLDAIQQSHPTLYANVYSVSLPAVGAPCTNCNVPGTSIPLSSWRYGIDLNPVRPNIALTELAAGSVGEMIDPNYRNPLTEQFNIGYQLGVTANDVLEVEYLHNLGIHEGKSVNINPLNPAAGGVRVLASAFANAGVPPLAQIIDAQSINRSRYDMLSIAWRRRMWKHFSTDSNYTWSRGVGWGKDAASFGGAAVNPFNIWAKSEFGFVPNDERQRLVLSGVVKLPFGFEAAAIMQLASPRAFTTSMGVDVFGYGSGNTKPHAIVNNSAPTDYKAYAGASSATINACLAANTCHQVGYDALRGQTFFQLDPRIVKDIKLKHEMDLKLAAQFFDVTNRANFGNDYGTSVTASTFDEPTGYLAPGGVTIPKAFRAEFGGEFSF
jgi:hypothetical protein